MQRPVAQTFKNILYKQCYSKVKYMTGVYGFFYIRTLPFSLMNSNPVLLECKLPMNTKDLGWYKDVVIMVQPGESF